MSFHVVEPLSAPPPNLSFAETQRTPRRRSEKGVLFDTWHVAVWIFGPKNAGNLGRAQQLDMLLRAWVSVHSGNAHHCWTLKLLGTGAREKELKGLAGCRGDSGGGLGLCGLQHSFAVSCTGELT